MFSLTDGGGEDTNYNKPTISLNRVSASSVSSKSSSTSSSPSPFSPLLHNPTPTPTPTPTTMEEVWKDINLASLHDQSPREALSVNPNSILQDFFATPFSKDPSRVSANRNRDVALYGSPLPPPATVLSLNSGPGFDLLDSSDPQPRLQNNSISAFDCPFAPSSTVAPLCKRKVQESDSSSGDRRHKRMIKNRESAARSRARKQAYTNELELAVNHLMEENEKLKRQQDQLRIAAAAQLSKKRTLQRTSTAPF